MSILAVSTALESVTVQKCRFFAVIGVIRACIGGVVASVEHFTTQQVASSSNFMFFTPWSMCFLIGYIVATAGYTMFVYPQAQTRVNESCPLPMYSQTKFSPNFTYREHFTIFPFRKKQITRL